MKILTEAEIGYSSVHFLLDYYKEIVILNHVRNGDKELEKLIEAIENAIYYRL